jgi:hypothetical protein
MKRIALSKEIVDKLCKGITMIEALSNLYRYAVPDWDNIEKVRGFPRLNGKTTEYIFSIVSELDRPLWINKGFSSDYKLPEWTIDLSNVTITYKVRDKAQRNIDQNNNLCFQITANELAGSSYPLAVKMRENPVKFIFKCSDDDLTVLFPICHHCLKEVFDGKLSRYRDALIKGFMLGTVTINI